MLPLDTSYPPMEATLTEKLPLDEQGWLFEPKWDGFRCLAFREQTKVELRSKSGQPLGRYFPEVERAVLALEAQHFVIDGELVMADPEMFSFDDLLERIHPAASRIKKLSVERPAIYVVFDLLVDEKGDSLVGLPLEKRKERLEAFAEKFFLTKDIQVSPATTDLQVARKWYEMVGIELDGVIAKRLGMPYMSGNRKGMIKVKNKRTADVVIGGFRYASNAKVVGSLLLGLYDEQGLLNHVGFTSSFAAKEKKALTEQLEPLIEPPGFTGNAPGGPSRWSNKRSEEWQPLKTQLVAEVEYDHFSAGRFRHGTKLLRWRPDKSPRQCTYEQLALAKGSKRLRSVGGET